MKYYAYLAIGNYTNQCNSLDNERHMMHHEVSRGHISEGISSYWGDNNEVLYLIQTSDGSDEARVALTREQVLDHIERLYKLLM